MRQKLVIVIAILIIGGGITTFMFWQNQNTQTNNEQQTPIEQETIEEPATQILQDVSRIKLSFNNEELYVKLDNTEISNDFVSMLPLTLTFEDYNSTEKIAYLPRTLTTQNAPEGYTPKVGDFAYYAPWGNLSIFYKEFRYSNSLIKLGEFESGIEKLENLEGNFEMTIEVAS